VRFSPHTRG